MINHIKIQARPLLAVLLCITPIIVNADTIVGRVVSVADGDTVTVLDASYTQHKIRLLGIDAPEKKQPFGTRSKMHMARLVYGKQVRVEYDTRDRYKRIVGKILVSNANGETDAGLEQIAAGMAWHYKQYERGQAPVDRDSYDSAERQAKSARTGLWSDATPIAPWLFRKGTKRNYKWYQNTR